MEDDLASGEETRDAFDNDANVTPFAPHRRRVDMKNGRHERPKMQCPRALHPVSPT